ncbi:MAG: hypothetical protein P0S95_03830 [Rhabdochlamydiaceae bacterium]|nr:hypothetical protein [Candidatus Amphrikana amoebophyrae]
MKLIKRMFALLIVSLCSNSYAIHIDKVVIWGHKLHSHTHSYIHYGFFKAFKKLGYNTLWIDNNDDISNIDFKNTLFLSEHQVDQNIPIRKDCYYVIHNSSNEKYSLTRKNNHYIDLKVYRTRFLNSPTLVQIAPYTYHDLPNQSLIIPWATDLLPSEIEACKLKSPLHTRKNLDYIKNIFWIGTIGVGKHGNINELTPFINACKARGIRFIHSDPWAKPVSPKLNLIKIQKSYLAPAIVGTEQLEEEYIPCRIFKNISYGHLGGTNSKAVYHLFNEKIVFNSDTNLLFQDMEERLRTITLEEQYELMDFIKENHTYLNRIKNILQFLELLATR